MKPFAIQDYAPTRTLAVVGTTFHSGLPPTSLPLRVEPIMRSEKDSEQAENPTNFMNQIVENKS